MLSHAQGRKKKKSHADYSPRIKQFFFSKGGLGFLINFLIKGSPTNRSVPIESAKNNVYSVDVWLLDTIRHRYIPLTWTRF